LFKINEPVVYYKSSENMEDIADSSIQLIVTSPPYGKIKDYGSDEQIGYFDSFDDYYKRLKNVWKECFRVLEPQCRMVINVGDQYLRTTDFGRYRILSIASQIINDCIGLGFDYLGDIIWQKVSTTNTTGGCSLMGSIYYPRNGLLTYDYEHILIFKKHKGTRRKTSVEIKELSKISLSEWKKWFVGHWKFPGIMQKEHIAMFPEELPYRIIRMFSFVGDTVLDPFVGSGTTLKVAKSLFRDSIGYELNENFKDTIETKIRESKAEYFKDYQYLLYIIHNKSHIEDFKIQFEKQKQKGIIFLRNNENVELAIDYLLIDENLPTNDTIKEEFKIKLKENTVQSYLKGQENWAQCNNYVIIMNSKSGGNTEFKSNINDVLNREIIPKKIQIFPLNDFISKDFEISKLFNP